MLGFLAPLGPHQRIDRRERLFYRLRVDEGEVVAVLEPNGSGKSTRLRTLAGCRR